MFKTFGLALATAAIGGPAIAGEWEIIGRSDNLAVGIDRLSIRATGSTRTYWKVAVSRVPERDDGGPYDYRLSRARVTCDSWTIASLTSITYRIGASAPVDSGELSGRANPVVPDTLGEAEAEYVCGDPEESVTLWTPTAEAFAIERRTSMGEFDVAWREQREPDVEAVFGRSN